MQPIQAVIFDLDDTLYSEKTYAFSGYRAVASAFEGVLGDPATTYQRMCDLFDSPHRARVFNVLLEEAAATNANELVPKMIDTFREHSPTIDLYDDADATLSDLRLDYKMGVISDGFLIAQQNKIDALNIQSRVDEVILTDSFGRDFWKPHPRAFEEIAGKLCVDHEACVYVADNLAKDFVAPNALGWRTIYIHRHEAIHSTNQAPDGGKPQHTIESLSTLRKRLTDTP